jgi:hypothetical protein
MEGSLPGELINTTLSRERKGRLGFSQPAFCRPILPRQVTPPVQGSFFNRMSLNWTFIGGPA